MTNIFLIYFTEVQLIHNVVLISAVQQSDSVIHIYIYIYIHSFSYSFPLVYHRILDIVPCVMQ